MKKREGGGGVGGNWNFSLFLPGVRCEVHYGKRLIITKLSEWLNPFFEIEYILPSTTPLSSKPENKSDKSVLVFFQYFFYFTLYKAFTKVYVSRRTKWLINNH